MTDDRLEALRSTVKEYGQLGEAACIELLDAVEYLMNENDQLRSRMGEENSSTWTSED